MSVSTASTGPFRLRARQGDAKTLLSWDLDEAATTGLAGFTISAQPPGGAAYFLYNRLTFADPSGKPVDVGSASLNFFMPAMGSMSAMNNPATFTTTGTPGVYAGKVNLEMAGEWQGQIAYEGAVGAGKATLTITAQ